MIFGTNSSTINPLPLSSFITFTYQYERRQHWNVKTSRIGQLSGGKGVTGKGEAFVARSTERNLKLSHSLHVDVHGERGHVRV